jgi:hypothetical protein
LRELAGKYRHFAKECLEMAARSEDEPTRAILRLMAQVWFRIAQEKECADDSIKNGSP